MVNCEKKISQSGIRVFEFMLLISLFFFNVFSQDYTLPWNLTSGNKITPESQMVFIPDNLHLSTPVTVSFQRGLTLWDWFNEPRPGQIQVNRFTKEDLTVLRSMGCEVIRLAADLLHWAGEAPDYKIDTAFFEYLDKALNSALEAGLVVILLNGSWDPVIPTDPAIEPVLLSTWTQMARHYKNQPDILYEILNEPHGISDSVWNFIQGKVIQAIRSQDQVHTIVVTPANYSSYLNLDAMPYYSDTNLLYTFHFYSPHLFTHQGTNWGDPQPIDLTDVPFPYNSAEMPALPSSLSGTWWEDIYNDYPMQGNENWVRSQLDMANQFQSARNVKLWCSEFGAFPPASSSPERAAWTEIVKSYMEEKGIVWTFLTEWIFEEYSSGSFETDMDTIIASALGFTPPVQKEPASAPETSGFTVYDDGISYGIVENGWFANGEFDLYSKESPHEGNSCLHITGLEQYGTVSFRFCPFRDLSFLVSHGSALDFWIRCDAPGTEIDIRFEDTKSDPDDHPWRNSFTLNSSVVTWNGEWQHLIIPLKDFEESGSWDNVWYNPQGLFDWSAADRLTIDAGYHSLNGIHIYFDHIRITDTDISGTEVSGELSPVENFPNPFVNSTTIVYSIKKPSYVSLEVYDLTGREITNLTEGWQNPGTYSVLFDAAGLRAGIYFYQLKMNDFSKTGKMLLVR